MIVAYSTNNKGKRSRKTTSNSNKKTYITLSLDNWVDNRWCMADTVLDWFIRVVKLTLDIDSRRSLENNKIKLYEIKKKLVEQHKPHTKNSHLPSRLLKNIDIESALSFLMSEAITNPGKCNFSGGIPPDLTAEFSEYLKTFSTAIKKKKKDAFTLCEDILMLAELGAFISMVGIERIDNKQIYHYIFSDFIRYIGDQSWYDRIKALEMIRRTARNLFLTAPSQTLKICISAAIAKSLKYVPKDVRSYLINSGLTYDYLRVEKRNVLNIIGFERIAISEIIWFITRIKIARPIYIMSLIYPKRSDDYKCNEISCKANAVFKKMFDTLCTNLFEYLNNILEVRYDPSTAKIVVIRNDKMIYDMCRELGIFLDRLTDKEEGSQLRIQLNKFLAKVTKKSDIDIINLVKDIMSGLMGLYERRYYTP